MAVTIDGTTGISAVQAGAVTSAALASGVPTRAQMPVGSVLQVVRASATAKTTTTSTNPVDLAGLSATITVQANSSVLIHCTTGAYGAGNGGSWGATGRVLLTNSANSNLAYSEHIGTISNESQTSQHTFFHLVTGLSAGSYTYKIRGSSTTGGSIEFNRDFPELGCLVLMEIAA